MTLGCITSLVFEMFTSMIVHRVTVDQSMTGLGLGLGLGKTGF